MRFCFTRLGATVIAAVMMASGALAQTAATDEAKRKIKSKSTPAYPELARRMNVSGKVKIEVIITPRRPCAQHPRDRWPPAPSTNLPGRPSKNGSSFHLPKKRHRSSNSIFRGSN